MDPLALDAAWSDSVSAAAKALWSITLGDAHRPFVEPPADLKFGDATSGVPMRLAKELKKPPRAIAEELAKKLAEMKPPGLARASVAGAGYVNLEADRAAHDAVIRAVLAKPDDWGRSSLGAGEKVLVEHTSANPTGPLHIAHARQAAIGESVACLLEHAGWTVGREFYVNDSGNQIAMLGRSVLWRYHELLGRAYAVDSENAYHGEYVREIAAALRDEKGDALLSMPEADAVPLAAVFGKDRLLAEQKKDLADFRVRFDTWSSQDALEKSGKVEALVADLRRRGLTKEEGGALWIRTKDLGHDKDDVLVKSDGAWTYRTPDTAYHVDKFQRGWERVVDLWGPDHHEHVRYMTTALKALGYDRFRVLTVQICHLLKGGEPVKFSKRAGNVYTLRELIDEVGVDAARFAMVLRKCDSPFTVDIEVLKKTQLDNPVWYVGYAHARVCSIVRKGLDTKLIAPPDVKDLVWRGEFDPAALGDAEILLLRHVRQFRRAVERAARDFDPASMVEYLTALSKAFQSYYTAGNKDESKRVLTADERVRRARLAACSAVQLTIQIGMRLLGAHAPDRLTSLEE